MRKLKVAVLAAQHDIHTVRWVNATSERGVETHLITLHPKKDPIHSNVIVHELKYRNKLGYYLNRGHLSSILSSIKPDLVHSHYASGYGTLSRSIKNYPVLLSAWGADVYDFPSRSILHKKLLLKNLRAASQIASTSHCMAHRIRKLMPEVNEILITPFGVEPEKFHPIPSAPKEHITIGTVKKLAYKYGIDTLIKGYALYKQQQGNDAPKTNLRLVGEGPLREELVELTKKLGIENETEFVGRVPHSQVCEELNKFDIYCAMSRLDSESFGVAVIEAQACEVPVIVSDVDGFREVVEHEKTGLIIQRDQPEQLAQAIARLVNNANERKKLGEAGRESVFKKYSWDDCVTKMISIYEKMAS